MEPLRTVEYAVRFAASLSAWWLLLAVPVVVLLGAWLYRIQARGASRGNVWGLTVLRTLILVIVVVLAFRPSLIRRNVETYPGRLLLVLDDSASMGIPDPALPEAEAFPIARGATDRLAGREAPIAAQRDAVLEVERILMHYEQFSRGIDRGTDAFFREAERVQLLVNERLEAVAQRATDLANTAPDGAKLREVATRCRDLQPWLQPLFSGDQAPGVEFGIKMRNALSELADLLAEAQTAADRAAMASGDQATAEALKSVRSTLRLELTYAWIKRHRDALAGAVKDVSLWLMPLSAQEPVLFSKTDVYVPTNSPADVETDLSGTLLKCIEDENPFPLAGIVVFSDGRNLGETLPDAVTRAASLRSVPLFCAGVGGAAEPPDLAVRSVSHAPIAVGGTPLAVRTGLKTVLPKPGKIELSLMVAGKNAISNETIEVAESLATERRLVLTPATGDVHRMTVALSGGEGEVVPQLNNQMDLVVRMRPDRVRVLLLDWKPRWETRFVLNVLGRLDYLDVNPIIVLAQPDGKLKRGVGKGFWPEDAGALALYDLVIVGDVPSGELAETEWKQLAGYVEEGGSLVLLGTGRADPVPASVAPVLLPPELRTTQTNKPADTAVLQLTPAGRAHPVTRSLRGLPIVQNAESVTADRRRTGTVGLLQTADGRSLISTHFSGKGKSLLVDTDRLWRRLNATALDAHTMLVAGMADWAIESRGPVAGQPRPDLYRYSNRDTVQVWTMANSASNPVVELRCGDRVLEAPALAVHTGATWAAAMFQGLPPGDWTVALRGGVAATEPIRVVDRSRELLDLSRDEVALRSLAVDAGGSYAALTDAARLLNSVQSRNRVERQEHIWRLWDSPWILGLVVLLLTIEWIWRKLAGLV